MDFQQLKLFISVASLKSFSQTAERMFISQPSVSRYIKLLEEELGVILIDRSRSKITLTDEGKRFMDYAQRLVNIQQEAVAELSSKKEQIQGLLYIGASTVPGLYLLPPKLAGFKKLHPQVEMNLTILDSSAVLENVLNYSFDLGFVGTVVEEKYFEFKPVGEDELLLAAPPGLFPVKEDRAEARITIEDCLPYNLLVRERGSATRLLLEQALRECGLKLKDFKGLVYISSLEGIKQAVRYGMGISFLSSCSVEDYLRAGWLCGYRIEDLNLKREFNLVYHRQRVQSQAAREFANYMLD
ncbi:MAG TPA: LysR family transcriptional regulator [Firmicutes bacterium]|nr:LysR family transcriptional regulator [Bacillota bacterium]